MKKTILTAMFLALATLTFAQTKAPKMQTVTIKTSAVCGMCKTAIESNLSLVKGVKLAILDLETQVVTVTFLNKKTDTDKIIKAINAIGYDANLSPADAKAYNNLPACCKKDMPIHNE